MSEFSPGGGNEDVELDDDKQEKALALLWCLGGHFRPQCGRFQVKLALFRPTRFEIGAVFSKSRLNLPAVTGFQAALMQ